VPHGRSRATSAPPEVVWEVWSDVRRWPEWNPDVSAVGLGSLSPGAVGTLATSQGTHEVRVKEVDPGRSFTIEAHAIPKVRLVIRSTVEPTASGGTTIAQGVAAEGFAALAAKPLLPRIAAAFGPLLDALARRAEERAAATA
jgi:uncharacterized protein YndB with AHSA1/START domain